MEPDRHGRIFYKESEEHICRVCRLRLESEERFMYGETRLMEVHCVVCGTYQVPQALEQNLRNLIRTQESKARVCHGIRMRSRGDQRPVLLTSESLQEWLDTPLPSIMEVADNLLVLFGQQSTGPGDAVPFTCEEFWARIGALDSKGVGFAFDFLLAQRLVVGQRSVGGVSSGQAQLSMEGWVRIAEIQSTASGRRVLVALKFGDEALDHLVDKHLKPAVRKTGFELFRISEDPKAGLIDNHLRVAIRTSRFLLVDLTHDNPGAYFEAGMAEGLGKPVFYLCEKAKFKGEKTHFDTNHHLTILWEADNPEKAAKELKDAIRATLPGEALMED